MPNKFVSLIAIVSVFVGTVNFLGVRDGSLTLGTPTYNPVAYDQKLLLEESVIQIIHTYLRNTMIVKNVVVDGVPLDFVERFVSTYGTERVNLDEEVIDASELLSEDSMQDLRGWVEKFAYPSSGPCPVSEGACTYYIGWNRDLPAGTWRFSGFRLSSREYLIVDESVLRFE